MDRRRIVVRRHRPMALERNGSKADWDCGRNVIGLIRRLVQRRAVEPHDVRVVVVEFVVHLKADAARFLVEVIVIVDVMGRKVAVGHCVIVIVPRPRLVDVSRRQR
jgi:hypothetical protein